MATRLSIADMLRNELEVDTDKATPLSQIFAEEPPHLSAFVADSQFLNNPPLSAIQFDFVRYFEQIFYPETYILMVEEFGDYWIPKRQVNELTLQWAKGSGKDHSVQIGFARLSNLLLCLKSPQDYYNLSHQTIVHMLNVAASAPQAHGVFFKPLRRMLTTSSWFADKFEGDLPGPQAQEIRFIKQIELISGHSQSETLEGKNLIAAVADEISAFPTLSEVSKSKTGRTPAKTSDAIIEMLRSSATTRFPATFKLAQISYPRYSGDAIEQARVEGEEDIKENGDHSNYYVSGPYATWEVNPRYDHIPRVEVSGAGQPVPDVKTIIKDYRKNPSYARAKYEARPDSAENRVFPNDSELINAFRLPAIDPVSVEYYWGIEDVPATVYGAEVEQVPGWQVRFHFHPDFRPIAGALYSLHGDMATSNDRAGICMTHVSSWVDREHPDGGFEQRPIITVDFATPLESDSGATTDEGEVVPRTIQIRWFRQLAFALRSRGFAVMSVSHDGFQSTDSLQILKSWGFNTALVSADRNSDAYTTLGDVLSDGRLVGATNELLTHELRSLGKLPNGKIDHPPNGSKDLADALACSVSKAIELGGEDGETPLFADDYNSSDLFTLSGASYGELSELTGSLGMRGGLGSPLW